MEELKIHQESTHKEFFEKYEKEEVGN